MSLAALRAKMSTNLETIKAQAQQGAQKAAVDSRFWKPTFDKEKGTGSAIIRFLPAPEGEDLPVIRIFEHSFKYNNKFFFEKSRITIGDKTDPLYVLNGKLYNSGVESDKTISKLIKRKPKFIANVRVINDPARPECNGKVFLYEFGPSIDEILQNAMFPPQDDVDPPAPVDIFNPWEGADFVIRMSGHEMPDGKGGMMLVPRYDKSTFKQPAPMGTDEVIESVWKQTHSLKEFVDPSKFKTVAELSKRLLDIFGPIVGSGIPTISGVDDLPDEKPASTRQVQETKAVEFEDVPDFPTKQEQQKSAAPWADSVDDDLASLAGLLDD